jgi:hypothetical protein
VILESTDVWGLVAALDRNGHRWFSWEVIKQPMKENQTMADNLSRRSTGRESSS